MNQKRFIERWREPALLLVMLVAGSLAAGSKSTSRSEDEQAAIEAVKALGGEISRDDNNAPGQPVTRVNLSDKAVTDADLKSLKGFTRLRELLLGSTRVTIPDPGSGMVAHFGLVTQLTDAGVKELQGLKGLQKLEITRCDLLTDAALKGLKQLAKLQTLVLTGCDQFTDDGLKELKQLKELQELRLGGTQLTDDGLKELAQLKKLRALELNGTWVKDAGLKHLIKHLKNLQELGLSGTLVTDAGLKELKTMKWLYRLGLNGTPTTEEGIGDLEQSLPDLQIQR